MKREKAIYILYKYVNNNGKNIKDITEKDIEKEVPLIDYEKRVVFIFPTTLKKIAGHYFGVLKYNKLFKLRRVDKKLFGKRYKLYIVPFSEFIKVKQKILEKEINEVR